MDIFDYFSEKEKKKIADILDNPYKIDKLQGFFNISVLEYKVLDQKPKSSTKEFITYEAALERKLKWKEGSLLKYVLLVYWQESPLHSRVMELSMKKQYAMEMAGLKNVEIDEEVQAYIVFFSKYANTLKFNSIIKDLEVINKINAGFEGDVGLDPEKVKNVVAGRVALVGLQDKVMRDIKNFYLEDSDEAAGEFQIQMIREDRFMLVESRMMSAAELIGVIDNPLIRK